MQNNTFSPLNIVSLVSCARFLDPLTVGVLAGLVLLRFPDDVVGVNDNFLHCSPKKAKSTFGMRRILQESTVML